MSRRSKPQYFTSAFVGYVAGVVLTIVVMNWFQAAQVSLFVSLNCYDPFFVGYDLMGFGLCFAFVSACSVVHCPRRHWVLGFSLHLER